MINVTYKLVKSGKLGSFEFVSLRKKFLLPRFPSPVFSRLGALSMEKINRVGCLRVIKLGTSRNPPVLLLLHCIDLIPFDDGIILIQPALPQPR